MKIFNGYIFKSKDSVSSNQPTGYKKIVNIYVEPQTGAIIVIYES